MFLSSILPCILYFYICWLWLQFNDTCVLKSNISVKVCCVELKFLRPLIAERRVKDRRSANVCESSETVVAVTYKSRYFRSSLVHFGAKGSSCRAFRQKKWPRLFEKSVYLARMSLNWRSRCSSPGQTSASLPWRQRWTQRKWWITG